MIGIFLDGVKMGALGAEVLLIVRIPMLVAYGCYPYAWMTTLPSPVVPRVNKRLVT